MASDLPADDPELTRWRWFARGARAAFSLPGFILAVSFIGFGSLAAEAGITQTQAVIMTGMIWALPAKVVLLGAIMSGNSLPAAALAVGLSSIRLMPMVMVLVPEMKTERTPRWVLYALSHFVAVTSWVLALERLRDVPRPMRTSYYFGLGLTLVLANMVVVGLTYSVADLLPPILGASLLLLTPMYFLTSLWASAREGASHVAMVLGLILGPVFNMYLPGFDLLGGGLLGGLGAYLVHLAVRRKRRDAF